MNSSRRVELGLLNVLVSVADTGSVSAAAARLSLSQPAVSNALKRLRELTNDKLFERRGRVMMPTPIAVELLQEARDIVERGNSLLTRRVFDPANYSGEWNIGVSEYGLSYMGAKLFQNIISINPNAQINFFPVTNSLIDDILSYKIDFAFIGDVGDPSIVPPVVFEQVFEDRYIGVMHKSHPLSFCAASMHLDDWLDYGHIRFGNRTPGVSSIDRKLAKLHKKRKVIVTSQSHRENLEILKGTNLLLAFPERLKFMIDEKEFITFSLPLQLENYPYFLIYHNRILTRPVNTFMRNVIIEALK